MYDINTFGMDQIQPDMQYTYDITDAINAKNNYKPFIKPEDNDDDKYIIKEKNQPKKETFSSEFIPIDMNQYSTKELIKMVCDKLSNNMLYLFIIFILIVICISQKQSMDQMKMLLIIALNNKDIKTPII